MLNVSLEKIVKSNIFIWQSLCILQYISMVLDSSLVDCSSKTCIYGRDIIIYINKIAM